VENHAQIGDRVVDENLKPVGKIFDIFGPVSSPYVSVKANVENPQSLTNRILYIVPSKGLRRERGKRR